MATVGEIYGVIKLKGGSEFVRNFKSISERVKSEVGTLQNIFKTAFSIYFGKKLIDASNKQEEAVRRVQVAVEQQGGSWQALGDTILRISSELQQKSWFGDEEVLLAMDRAINAGADYADVVQNIGLIVDFAAARNMDLGTAAEYVARAMQGDANMLARYIPKIRTLNEEQRTWQNIRKLILEMYGGKAAQLVDSETGRMRQAANAIGDLAEKGGDLIKKVFLPMVNAIIPVVDWLNNTNQSVRNMIASIIAATAAIRGLQFVLGLLNVSLGPAGWLIAGLSAAALAFGFFQAKTRGAKRDLSQFVQVLNQITSTSRIERLMDKFRNLDTETLVRKREILLQRLKAAELQGNETLIRINKDYIEAINRLLEMKKENAVQMTEQEKEAIRYIEQLENEKMVEMHRRAIEYREQLEEEARQRRQRAQEQFIQEVKARHQQLMTYLQTANEQMRNHLQGWATNIQNSVSSVMTAFVTDVREKTEGMKNTWKAILIEIINMLERKYVLANISIAIDTIIEGAGPTAIANALRKVAQLSVVAGMMEAAKASIMAMAEGGLVTGPTLALIGEKSVAGQYQPEVVAPVTKFERFAREVVERVTENQGINNQITFVQNFSTPFTDKRIAQKILRDTLKPELERYFKSRQRFVNKNPFGKS